MCAKLHIPESRLLLTNFLVYNSLVQWKKMPLHAQQTNQGQEKVENACL